MKNDAYKKFTTLLDSAVRNLSRAFYDQYVEVNTRFRAKAGLKVTIIREELGTCCDWCADLAGIYSYDSVPKDVWARHANCRCVVITRTEKGTYQDAWSRKDYKSYKEARIAREQEIVDELDLNALTKKDINKSIDILRRKGYSNSPSELVDLITIYKADVEDGWISPLSGFENYLRLYNNIDNEIIGRETCNGIKIAGKTRHFMQRVIGTAEDPNVFAKTENIISRSGVRIEDIKEAISNGTPRNVIVKDGQPSQLFIGSKCKVSINPNTGFLIQCNPWSQK